MRRGIAVAGAVAAVAVGGTAVAAPGGGPFGGLLGAEPEERRAELARDLASKLDGVSPREVERALDEVQRERGAERRREMARALAAKLDGVSVEQVERALEKSHEQMRRGFERGRFPQQGPIETLARELGKSEQEVRRAFEAIHRERLDKELDEAVREGRITEEQADRIRERAERGPRFFRRRFGPPGGPWGGERPAPPPRRGGPGPGDFVMPAPGPPPEV